MPGSRLLGLGRALSPVLVGTALLLPACALLSCGDPSTEPAPGASPVFPPQFPRPQVRTTVAFGSPSDPARYARYVVIGRLNQVQLEFGAFGDRLEVFRTVPYRQVSATEWSMTANAGMTGCQVDYWVEMTPVNLRWNCYWSGSCGPGCPRYPSPVAAMKTLLNGSAGQLDVYWLWDVPGKGRMVWESDPAAGQRTFRAYERRSAGPLLLVTLVIRDRTDGSQESDLARPGEYRWQAHISGDGRSGSFRLDRPGGAGSDWAVADEITWANGHGSRTAHSVSGEVEQSGW